MPPNKSNHVIPSGFVSHAYYDLMESHRFGIAPGATEHGGINFHLSYHPDKDVTEMGTISSLRDLTYSLLLN